MNIKIVAIILILGAGFIGSFLIMKNSAPAINVGKDLSGQYLDQSGDKSPIQNPLQWVENLIPSKNFNSPTGPARDQGNAGSENQNSANLTKLVAESIFGRMKKMDQSDDNPFDSLDPTDPQNQELTQEILAGLRGSSLIFDESINENDLKISQNDSKEAKIKYLKEIEQISNNRFRDPKYQRSADQIIKDINVDCLSGGGASMHQELAALYQNLVGDYLNLSVPLSWLDFHKKIILHFKKAASIYRALANCSKDPIKGYLAIEALPQLTEGAQKIQDLVAKKYAESGL